VTASVDAFDPSIVLGGVPWLLAVFNRADVLGAAEVHTALRLATMGGDPDEQVALAVALAVRGPRVGHVSVDLATIRQTLAADGDDDVDVDGLPWPEPDGWIERISASPIVAVGEAAAERPVRLVGTSLYLDRHWRDELAVASDLRSRAAAGPAVVDESLLGESLDTLFPGSADAEQIQAVTVGTRRAFAVVAGGPGTGKTTTVARLLAAIHQQARHRASRPPLVALAAPTGKAAARLEEAVRAEAARLQMGDDIRAALQSVSGTTLHRLLGSRPGTARFRHHRGNRLPHDIVVVDEASMISLAMMARLTEATRPDAHLILVGDPEQLVSVEAGAVLADIAGPATSGSPSRARPAAPLSNPAERPPIEDSIVRLRTNHRFAGALADLAAAVRAGDPDATMDVLRRGDPSVNWVSEDSLRPGIAAWAERMVDAARAGDAGGALTELGSHRVLCAHRRGPSGVAAWNAEIELWLRETRPDIAGEGAWYAGRPVLVTANDYSLRLFNGDTGVTLGLSGPAGSRVSVAFGEGRRVGPSRLADIETVYAMTVHKSQGSEFTRVTLLLPDPGSRVLTRELLYTGVTRAREALGVAGSEDAIRTAVLRPIARASGLARRLRQRE
jgi:exodeoxyribonuclease V alpha subunit